MFDSFLLQAASQFSMLDMRDNMLAADLLRFGGANQDLIWNAFAAPAWAPARPTGRRHRPDAELRLAARRTTPTVTLRPLGDGAGAAVRLYVGDYEARATPMADTDPATPLPDTFQVVPARSSDFLAVGAGFGHQRFTQQFRAGTGRRPAP